MHRADAALLGQYAVLILFRLSFFALCERKNDKHMIVSMLPQAKRVFVTQNGSTA
jgi:hypothetical protein